MRTDLKKREKKTLENVTNEISKKKPARYLNFLPRLVVIIKILAQEKVSSAISVR